MPDPVPTSLPVILLSLGAALGWGAGDFLGGLATRRISVFLVMIGVILISLPVALALALLLQEPLLTSIQIFWAALSGVLSMVGFMTLYRALAFGKMGVAAPVSGVVATMTAGVAGFLLEGWPLPLQIFGFLLAPAGIWLLSRPEMGKVSLKDLALPFIAGLSFGLYYIVINQANQTATFWPIFFSSLASLLFQLAVAWMFEVQLRSLRQASWRWILPIAAVNTTATVLFLVAARNGQIGIVSVLSSLYPAFTVLLAWAVLKENLTRSQWVGVLATMLAIRLIVG